MDFSEVALTEAAARAYNEGNANFEIISANCALLVIDMQDEFVRPGWTSSWVPEATRLVPKMKMLIDHCRQKNIPVIYTVFSNTHHFLDRPKTGSAMPNRYPELSNSDEWFTGIRIWPELEPHKDDIVICKPSYGAFYDTPLDTILKNLNKDTIIICGTLTNFCCGTTARQGYERGYKVIFGSDVTATDLPEMQEPELKVLRKGFAKVIDLKGMLEVLK